MLSSWWRSAGRTARPAAREPGRWITEALGWRGAAYDEQAGASFGKNTTIHISECAM